MRKQSGSRLNKQQFLELFCFFGCTRAVSNPLVNRRIASRHRVVDEAHEIITAVETTGAVNEGARLLTLIEAHEDITEQRVRTVIADSRYGRVGNLIECQKSGIRPHLKLLGDSTKGKGRSAGIYPEERFIYDPAFFIGASLTVTFRFETAGR